jgi:hypothetical protein
MGYIGAGITRFNTADELTVTGDAEFNGNVTLGDSDIAQFGAGTDLQILSNGSVALIKNGNATSDIRLESDNRVVICDRNFNEAFAVFNDDDDVKLYHNGSEKFATTSSGIDVTGTALAHTVEIGDGSAGGTSEVVFSDNVSGRAKILYDHGASPNEEMGFEIAGTRYMTIENGGNVGIGTASPDNVNGLTKGGTHLMVNNDSGGARLNVEGSTDARLHMVDTGASANQKTYLTKVDGGNYTISLENDAGTASERLRIDSSGNVLVGTTTEGISDYGDTLTIADSDHCGMTIRSGTSSEGNVYFSDGTSGDAEYKGIVKYEHSSNDMSFWSNSLRRMTIDSSGNVLVGTTDTTPANNNVVGVSASGSLGSLQVSRDGSTPVAINRKTSDGDLVSLKKDGSTVGSIGSFNGNAYYAGTGCGLRPRTGDISPTNASGSTNDGGVDLGTSSNRFQNIWLSGGAYLGGTATANKLDDYETGTWTPTVGSGVTSPSYDAQSGSYVKIGGLVIASFNMDTSGGTLNSNQMRFDGLPFAKKNSDPSEGGYITYEASFYSTGSMPYLGNGSTGFVFHKRDGTDLSGTDLSSSNFICRGTIIYRAS